MAEIEIDGKKLEVEPGAMIIEVADQAGIRIPRFCYHEKLSIAANCRMCLVEVENARKPVPACATPVNDGMKVFTKSPVALAAQKSVMEFLLINHPLDCPICDQGGECELQDVSMGYGKGISQYTEGKRVVNDENLGSLISTDMTRCIHCTRCVRFGEEIAGVRELGLTSRGENSRIGTYIQHQLISEVSGNVIDLCPVGALTNKPFRFTARAWELQQKTAIAPHDCLGSHINLHTRRQEVMRAVPAACETINETWLSDRDRYAVHGLQHEDRVTKPLIKLHGHWIETDWETALTTAVKNLKKVIKQDGMDQVAFLAHPSSTVEEFYSLQKLMRGLGGNNIDHRIHINDFSDQDQAPIAPIMSCPYENIEKKELIVLVGSSLNHEQPLAAVRVRKAIASQNAKVISIDVKTRDFHFPIHAAWIVHLNGMVRRLAGIAKALTKRVPNKTLTAQQSACLNDITPTEDEQRLAESLNENAIIIHGAIAEHHPQAAALRALTQLIASLSGADYAFMTDGANSQGAWLAGAIPHRTAAGKAVKTPGFCANTAFAKQLKAYLLFNIEAELDTTNPGIAISALRNAECVVACATFKSETLLTYADVILPVAAYPETSGTFVNIEGKWQTFHGSVKPFEQSRPGWKVLRVLANLFDVSGFDYVSSQDILAELSAEIDASDSANPTPYFPEKLNLDENTVMRVGEWPIYRIDGLVRRSLPLTNAALSTELTIQMHSDLGKRFNLRQGKSAEACQLGAGLTLPVELDNGIAANTVILPSGFAETGILAEVIGPIDIK